MGAMSWARWALAGLCVWGMAAAGAGAQSVRLESLRINGQVAGAIARSSVELTAANESLAPQSAQFVLSLPDSVGVDLVLWLDGDRYRGAIVPQTRAETIYRRIVQSSRDPALFRQIGPGLYQLDMFPVPPLGRMTVEVSFVHLLSVSQGKARYVPPKIVHSSVQDSKTSIARHVVNLRQDAEPAILATLAGDFVSPTAEVYAPLLIDVPGLADSTAVADGEGDGLRSFVVRRQFPVKGLEISRSVVYVLDLSASMLATDVVAMRSALEALLGKLHATDRFGLLVLCGGEALAWKPALMPADEKARAAALSFAAGLKRSGGTDLRGGHDGGDRDARELRRRGDRPPL